MSDILVIALALIGAASLIAFFIVGVGDIVRRRREWRWQREYERELAEAEEELARDLEWWGRIEVFGPSTKEPS